MHCCMKRLAQGVSRRRIRTNECLGRAREVAPAAHASTEALAGGAELKASRTCNHPPWRCEWLIDCRCCMNTVAVQRLAQGVSRRQIRTNECLGHAQEVAPAAHASTEALARGGGVLPRHTCNQFHRRCGIRWWCCMHCCMKRLAQGVSSRRIRTNGCFSRAFGGSSRCPCLNGGACWRHRCVGNAARATNSRAVPSFSPALRSFHTHVLRLAHRASPDDRSAPIGAWVVCRERTTRTSVAWPPTMYRAFSL